MIANMYNGKRELQQFLTSVEGDFSILGNLNQGLDATTIQKAKYLLEKVLSPQHTLVFITHYEGEIPKGVDRRFLIVNCEL